MTGMQYDDVDTKTVAIAGIISAIATFVIIIALDVIYQRYQTVEVIEKRIDAVDRQAGDIIAEQQTRLANYAWINKTEGIVEIPIDQAMEITVKKQAETAAKTLPAGATN